MGGIIMNRSRRKVRVRWLQEKARDLLGRALRMLELNGHRDGVLCSEIRRLLGTRPNEEITHLRRELSKYKEIVLAQERRLAWQMRRIRELKGEGR